MRTSLLLLLLLVGLLAVSATEDDQAKDEGNKDEDDDDDEDEDDDYGDIEIVDLYAADGPVVHMDNKNFHSLLEGKRHIWVVEFYNSWCGHCRLYAPVWLRVAQQSAAWESVLKVGAINCARSENLAICRNYDVGGYPWVKLFPPMSKMTDLGEKADHKLQEEMLQVLVDYATDLQNKTHPPSWPNLAPFTGSLSEFLSSPEPVHALVVEGASDSSVGRQVILDLSAHRQRLRLARAQRPPAGLQLTETGRPVLVTFRAGQRQPDLVAGDGLPPRPLFTAALRRELGLRAGEPPAQAPTTTTTSTPVVAAGAEEGAAAAGKGAAASGETVGAGQDAVYMVDLEKAVTYALQQEVAGKKDISGEPLSALRNFVEMLIKYLPVRKSLIDALTELKMFLRGKKSVGGAEVQHHLEQAKTQLPEHKRWLGCKGSKPGFRGYTCGLWSIFHTVTVQTHNVEERNDVSILPAIHGYVKNFFSCSHCSQHFQEMSRKEGLLKVKRSDEAMVWLWRAHNIVNKRLAGDLTEDPKHPKVQFPTKAQCPACFSYDQYYEPIIISFLHSFYGQSVMKLDGLTGSGGAASGERASAATSGAPRNRVELVSRVLGDGGTSRDSPASPGLLSGTDISLCVLLWGFSFVTLVLAFFLFRMKRSYRRKHKNSDCRPFFK